MTNAEHAIVALSLALALTIALWAVRWWFTRRQRACQHHEGTLGGIHPASSWVDGWLIDSGRRKKFMCTHCYKVWIV